MKRLSFFFFGTLLAVLVLGAGPAPAAPKAARDPGVNQRQDNQKSRIRQGVRSGELTRKEAKELREGQREIRKKEREYKSDGVLTGEERRDLHQDLNAQSREIRRAKHDDDKRPRADCDNPYRDTVWHKMNRKDRQRIARGIRSGEITNDELRNILESRRDLREEFRDYLEDGELSDEEAQAVRQGYHEWSKTLFSEMHDDEER